MQQKQIAETDLATQARLTAAQVAKNAQAGAKNAADGFNRFVEGNGGRGEYSNVAPLDESKKDFWDSFADSGNAGGGGLGRGGGGSSAIGTSAVKKADKKGEDDWDRW